MNRRTFARLALLVLVFACAPLALWAQTQAGAIKAARLIGTVTKAVADGTNVALTEGQVLIETDVVTTGPDSSAVLVFANGSSVKLGANSRLAIEEFKMDPLDDSIAVAELKGEPTVSKTRLNLAYGEIVGNVKKLNVARGSSFDIKTPVGAAGIRGTTFRIVMQFQANGQVTFQLSTAEGRIVFTGTVQVATSGTPSQEGAESAVDVVEGQEVTAVATVDSATNQVTAVQVSTAQPISAAATEAITIAVTQGIQQAQQATTFTQTEQQEAAKQTSPPSTETTPGTKTETQNETKTEPKSDAPPANTPITPVNQLPASPSV